MTQPSKLQEIFNQTYSLKMKKEDLARIRVGVNRRSVSIRRARMKPRDYVPTICKMAFAFE